MSNGISPQRRQEIIDALRRGTVPRSSLDAFAVGLDALESPLEVELQKVKAGGSVFKAVRGEYGCGKTFFARWLGDRARKMGFATSEVQISETETPLHRLETICRRITERLSTVDTPQGALRNIIDGWFFTLEEDVLAEGVLDPADESRLLARTNDLLEQRLPRSAALLPCSARRCVATGRRRLTATRQRLMESLPGSPVSQTWRPARSDLPA